MLIGTLFSMTLIINGVDNSIETTRDRLGADLLVVPRGAEYEVNEVLMKGTVNPERAIITGVPLSIYMDESIEEKIRSIPGVARTSSQVYIATIPGSMCPCHYMPGLVIVGFDPETDFTIKPWLRDKIIGTLGKDEIIVGSSVARAGELVEIYEHEFLVKASLERTGSGIDESVFIRKEDLYLIATESEHESEHSLTIKPNQISSILIEVASDASTSDISWDIMNNISGVYSISSGSLGQDIKGRISNILSGVSIALYVSWGLSVLLVGSIFLMSVNERRREIGLLRALGANNIFIFRIIVSEAILITVIGGIVGVLGGATVLYIFIDSIIDILDVPYLWPSFIDAMALALRSLGLAALTGILASFYPAYLSSKMEPYDAIRAG